MGDRHVTVSATPEPSTQDAFARASIEKLVAWLAKIADSAPRDPDRKAYLGDDAYVGGAYRHEAMTWAEVKAIVDAAGRAARPTDKKEGM